MVANKDGESCYKRWLPLLSDSDPELLSMTVVLFRNSLTKGAPPRFPSFPSE